MDVRRKDESVDATRLQDLLEDNWHKASPEGRGCLGWEALRRKDKWCAWTLFGPLFKHNDKKTFFRNILRL